MGIGDFVSGVFGSENEFTATAPELDKNAYQYGGREGAAQEAAEKYDGRANRQLEQANAYAGQQQHMFNRGNQGLDMSNESRGQQMGVANMMLARARGQTPSIAQMQGDRATQQMTAQQASAAASARGPAALALAQQNAANNTATAQSQIAGQTSIAAAQERLAAEQAAMGAYSNIRGADIGQAQTAFGAGAQSGQLGIASNQNAQGWAGMENQVNAQQLNAQMNYQAQRSANELAAQSINAGVAGQNAQTNQQNAMGVVGMGASVAGSAASSDERAKQNIEPLRAKSTWGTGKGVNADQLERDVDQRVYEERVAREGQKDAESRQHNTFSPSAGGGFMLGQEVGTSAYGGRPMSGTGDGSGQKQIQAGMESTGAKGSKSAKEDAKGAETAAKSSRVAAILGSVGDTATKSGASQGAAYHPYTTYQAPQLLSVLARAEGGPVNAGQPYLVGEKGPELMVPQQSGTVINNDQTAGIAKGMAGQSPSGMIGKLQQMDADSDVALAKNDEKKHPGTYVMKGTGMDVMGTIKQQSRVDMGGVGQATSSPTNQKGLLSGLKAFSDERAKTDVVPLTESPGTERHWDRDVSSLASKPNTSLGASLSGSVPKYSVNLPALSSPSSSKGKAAERKPTLSEAERWANTELAKTQAQTAALDSSKPSVNAGGEGGGFSFSDMVGKRGAYAVSDEKGKHPLSIASRDPMANANRSMQGYAYEYKPGVTPPDQQPGEKNVGPMAQSLAADPIASTAVKQDEGTGLLVLDRDKMMKLNSAGIASLQQQNDEQEARIAALSKKLGKRGR